MSAADTSALVPGVFVRNPAAPEWGLGQVQSAVGGRVTVNFEHAGKQVIRTEVVALDIADPDALPEAHEGGTAAQPRLK
ncbi:MAG: DUF3553 domain-containing protein [Rhodospirillaceae bacterium]|nr:DUF3553 domain-containing protein [Rhodospirillaceae bacterium]